MVIKIKFLIISIFIISISTLAIPSDQKTDENINPPKISNIESFPSLSNSDQDDFSAQMNFSIVTAVVVKSWYYAGTELIWQHINENWWKYGITEVIIDHTSLSYVDSFTIQDLNNSGANVIIVSDPAGGGKQFTQSEYQALSEYCSSGHNLLGTYLVFNNITTIDNRFLAPLWGLKDSIQYSITPVSAIYYYQDPTNYIFTNINEPYISNGYPHSQSPTSGNWITSGINGAQVVGLTQDTTAIITQYNAGNYWSIYISNMPEYYGDSLDAQFLYNAITFNDQFSKIDDKVKNEEPLPRIYSLGQNYPNPFNPSTKIIYNVNSTHKCKI